MNNAGKLRGKIAGTRLLAGVRFSISILFVGTLLSCASSGAPPIESREPPPSKRINTHEVQQGETLYSIAWRYETDYREMARINGLVEPYELAYRQQLKIYDDGSAPSNVARAPVRTSIADRSSVRTAPVIVGTSTSVSGGSAARGSASSGASQGPTSTNAQVQTGDGTINWAWPVKGRLVSAFGASAQTKGVVIDPGATTEVSAAADGIVVYAGTGIRGVGNLIIIKHSNLFLSAYAYNSALLSKEGDQVRAGQSIARVGKNADGSARVYFEIRKDGNPVDPIRYLPAR